MIYVEDSRYKGAFLNHTSNIASVRILSSIDRKPRAPVFFDIAFLAISLVAPSVKCNWT